VLGGDSCIADRTDKAKGVLWFVFLLVWGGCLWGGGVVFFVFFLFCVLCFGVGVVVLGVWLQCFRAALEIRKEVGWSSIPSA